MPRIALCSLLALLFVACGDDLPNPGADAAPTGPQCSNGVDDDGDGNVDFPDDPGCESSIDETEEGQQLPACSDNRDNDGDGKADFPDDPGCQNAGEDDESDDCPDGPGCPQCGNGVDDDLSGNMDFPGDPGCESAGDPIEFSANPVACGANMNIMMLPASGLATGTLDGSSTSSLVTKCGGGGGAAAQAYVIVLTQPKILVASTVDPMTNFDTVIDVRSADCDAEKAHLTCNDDTGNDTSSTVTTNLTPGVYYIIVEGQNSSELGTYALKVNLFSSEGAECTTQDDCAPGLVCRVPAGETAMVCSQPVCNDGRDDDQDGVIDFPNDPGCESPSDNDETDDCPSGPNCPACSNDNDDDGDGQIDFPADTGCSGAGSNIEGCGTEQDPIVSITGSVTTGTTVGAHNDFDSDCGSSLGTSNDVQFTLSIPTMRTLTIDTVGSSFDTTVAFRASTCVGEIDCDDDGEAPQSALDLTDVDAGLYIVAVDGFSDDDLGAFTLNVSGTIAVGGSCEGALFAAGAITCEGAATCEGTLGSRICQTECSDGIDNNADGKVDFPDDPGCTSPGDGDETDVCPGANCPQCADGTDNDGDGATDFPDDTSCSSASETTELDCPSTEPIGAITTKITTGTTVGQTHDVTPTCGSGSTAPDIHLQLDLPTLKTLSLVLTPESGFDADIALFDSTCGPAGQLACGDGVSTDSVSLTNVNAGRYFVEVDGDATAEVGTFSINLTGVIAKGGSCESPLFTDGALTCEQNLPCTGAVGAKKCQAQCSDGIDNDGDGLTDFPDEPGCTSIADDSETDNCPNGVGCPQCSNGIDDDGDGQIDFGADLDCVTAATNSEGSQCFQTDDVGVITSFFTNGTTTGKADDIDLNCGSSAGTGPDTALSITVPKMRRLSLDLLLESGFDSVHALLTQQCTLPALLCRDPADLDFNNLAAGTYFVVVDGFNTSEFGVFTLLTSGEIEAGGSCEGPLFESGAFTCADNLPCEGTPGSRICKSECSDGIDNNGTGGTDFPNDPGCASPSDLIEDTVCPGANCPQCADGIDNDANGLTDFPADTQCTSAGDNQEQACTSTEPVTAITTKIFTGTTTGATHDFTPTCGSGSTAPDRHFRMDLPALASLNLTLTPESGYDADIALFNSTCGPTALGCGDGFSTDVVSVTNLAAGTYFVEIDGDATAEFGAFSLNTTGVIAPGGACTSPLFTDGALTCSAGQTCNGTVCAAP